MKLKKIISAILSASLAFSLGATVFASDVATDSTAIQVTSSPTNKSENISAESTLVEGVDVNITLQEAEGEKLTFDDVVDGSTLTASDEVFGQYLPKGRTIYETTENRLDHSAALSPSNTMNYYVFRTTSTKFLLFGGVTNNANVRVGLYVYEPSTGNLYDTGVASEPNKTTLVNQLPPDNYCLVVYSTAAPTSNITVRTLANFSMNYNSSASIYNVSSDLAYIQYSIGAKRYVNERYICDVNAYNNQLTYQYNSGDSVNHYMSVTEPKIYKVSVPISFESTSGAYSPAAVLVYMDQGTMYCYKKSILNYVPGGVSGTSVSFIDFRMGTQTPRPFDRFDVEPPRDQVLVVDIATGKIIDFVGSANYFYHTGAYQATMTII